MALDYSVFSGLKPALARAPLGFALAPAELASLLASRICHDLISPIGAINNAMELYEEGLGDDEALQLISMSAANASARLQFGRLAYGTAGSAGDSISAAAAEKLARDYLDSDKIRLSWQAEIPHLPKNAAKFLLNLIALAAASVPRGGELNALLAQDEYGQPRLAVSAEGALCRLPPPFAALYQGEMAKAEVSAHNIQFYWLLALSDETGLPLAISENAGRLYFIV